MSEKLKSQHHVDETHVNYQQVEQLRAQTGEKGGQGHQGGTRLQENDPGIMHAAASVWGAFLALGNEDDGEEEANDSEELPGLPNKAFILIFRVILYYQICRLELLAWIAECYL